MPNPHELLKTIYGYDEFRPGQEAAIDAVLSGRDVLSVMPTGAGKSVCFQIPALLLPGITVVISPLISLMKDQVDTLREMGIATAVINSAQDRMEELETWDLLRGGDCKLLYVAPERLMLPSFLELITRLNCSFVAVDESHCVSQWGHDFRTSYLDIKAFIESFPKRPVVGCYTATATSRIREDIIDKTALQNPLVSVLSFDRENLFFSVETPSDKSGHVLQYIRERAGDCGIIYASTRKNVDELSEFLRQNNVSAVRYHAGVSPAERKRNQDLFIDDNADVIVATNAFGMGIDKSNVRYVLHYNMPKNMESYYQEAGRAGRDGLRSECVILFSAQDIYTNKFLISQSDNEESKANDYALLQKMVDYCKTENCLRQYILNYFGEDAPDECGNCGSCAADGEKLDITVPAQKIISCVKRMGERFGRGLVINVLRGSMERRVTDNGFDRLSTHGIMKDVHERDIRHYIDLLIGKGLLKTTDDEFPLLMVTAAGMSFAKSGEPLFTRKPPVKRKERVRASELPQIRPELFEQLKALRREVANDEGVPPFVVFSDSSLWDMCRRVPRDETEFLAVSGVGRNKFAKYGERFIEVTARYRASGDYVEAEYAPQTPAAPPVRKPRAVKPKAERANKGATYTETLNMLKNGMRPDEIAEARGLNMSTVESHICKLCQAGSLSESDYLRAEHVGLIEAAFRANDDGRLSTVKAALPEEIGYLEIKLVQARLTAESE
ncbi:MAG: DNA helicase RecQ [Oscillospiraceae bacterium]|jgi:ATP-dependent DNA helicase RecQ|nr:DNA helicase RecQ [Oscillospiraceae bacterium]